jgi:hypothetical protein
MWRLLSASMTITTGVLTSYPPSDPMVAALRALLRRFDTLVSTPGLVTHDEVPQSGASQQSREPGW